MNYKTLGNFLILSGRGIAAVSVATFVVGLVLLAKEKWSTKDDDNHEIPWNPNNRCLECSCMNIEF
jgi:hypothetical protein